MISVREHQDAINRLARQVHGQSLERNAPTRPLAQRAMATCDDVELLRHMAAELLVVLIDNARRKPTAIRPVDPPAPRVGRPPGSSTRIPRKGTAERHSWESETDEGRAWAAAEAEADRQASESLSAALKAAVDSFTSAARLEWTREMLDRDFMTATGVEIAWGDATADEHDAAANSLLEKASRPVRDAALHQMAARDLREAKALTLRHLAEAA